MDHSGKLLWEPAVYEHKAALIGRRPADVGGSADLLEQALEAEYRAYGADFMTVGIDVYNVEAEACGALPVTFADDQCPEIASPLWTLDALPTQLVLPPVPASGRFPLLLEAARRFRAWLARQTPDHARPVVRVAASGPLTIAAKLVGTEELLMGLAAGDPPAVRLLDFTTALAESWVTAIREHGFDAIVFDSTASPPMLSPTLYRDIALPVHTRLMRRLEHLRQRERPLVLGGDTTSIAGLLVATGANQVVCDYAAGAAGFAASLKAAHPSAPVSVRRNVSPALLSADDLDPVVSSSCADLAVLPNPICGTGILPYDQDPDRYRLYRLLVEERVAKR